MASEQITAWIAEHAIPLKGHDVSDEHGDLEPLAGMLRDVQVVGLGEATHGSREFFQLKHRIIRYLVQEMNTTVLAVEAGYSACLAINAYVRDGVGEPAALLRAVGYWPWDTVQMLELIRWLRDWNRDKPRAQRVQFHGIDPVIEPAGTRAVAAQLDAMDAQRAARFRTAVAVFDQPVALSARAWLREGCGHLLRKATLRGAKPGSRAAARQQARATIAETQQFLNDRGEQVPADVLQHMRVIERATELSMLPLLSPTGSALRDKYMAESVRLLLADEPAGSRAVIWAHNYHVARARRGSNTLGSQLAKHYGERYYCLGLAFDHGSFHALQMPAAKPVPQEFSVGSAKRDTVEWHFVNAGVGDCLVDLRAARGDERVRNWLRGRSQIRYFGGAVTYWPVEKRSTATVRLGKQYDGLAFVAETTRTEPNAH